MKKSILIAILAVFALLVPASCFAGTIGEADTNSYLSRITTDGEYIYVMGTYKASQLWVNKYRCDDVDTPVAEWRIGEEDSNQYWAGDSAYNGALTVDAGGNVWLAATRGTGAQRQLMVYELSSELKMVGSSAFGTMTTPNPGGTFNDPAVRDIAVSENGDIYLAGDTREKIDEWTEPKYQFEQFEKYSDSGQRTGRRIGYVVHLDPEMNLKDYTYMGSGSNGGTSAVNRILCDGASIYVLGRDASGQVPTGDGVLQPEKVPQTSYSDTFDAFLMRMNGQTLEPELATYYGGSGTEEVADMKIVGQNIYVFGDTTSDDLPLSDAPYSEMRASGSSFYTSPFIMRISKSLKRTDSFAATYFGDAVSTRIDSFGMDVANGKVYITGTTKSPSSIPVTDGSDKGHIFVAILQADLSSLRSASMFGTGASGDMGRGICRTESGLYLAGTLGTEGLIDTQIRQPFVRQIPETLAHSTLTRLAMKQFVSDAQYLGEGQEILLKLTFDANVRVKGSPVLKLNIQNGEDSCAEAGYVSGSGTKELIFSYTVRAGDTTDGQRLATTGEDALQTGEGSIYPAAGSETESADLKIPTGTDNRLEYASGDRVYVNTIPAGVSSVTTDKDAGTYTKGEEIEITITVLDHKGKGVKLKTAGGTPVLHLNSGGTAVFREFAETAGGNDGRMRFVYAVGDRDLSQALDYTGPEAFDLQGASLTDPYGTAVDIRLPQPGEPGSLSSDKTIIIENDVPAEKPEGDINAITPTDAAADAAPVDRRLPVIAAGKMAATGSITKKQMRFSWGASKGAVNYRYAWRQAGAKSWNYGWTAGKAGCTLSALKVRGLYEFRVAAYAKAGGSWVRSEWSAPVCRYFQTVTKVKAKAKKGKKIKVTWKKQSGSSGYQVLYSVKKTMKGAKVRTVKGASKKTVTLKKLKKGKKYYVKVRPYKTWKGKKYIGVLSGAKAAKARK